MYPDPMNPVATSAPAPARRVARRRSTCWRSRPARPATSTARTASSCPRRCSTRAAASGWPTSCSRRTSASSSRRTGRRTSPIAWQGGEPTLMGVDFFRRVHGTSRSTAGPGCGRVHDPDQRHAHRRRARGASSRSTTSWSGSASTGRRRCTTPTGSTAAARRRRSGSCAGSRPQAARRRVQHPDHAPPGERRPPARGLPLPARRARVALPPVHPDHRAAADAADRRAARPARAVAGAGPGGALAVVARPAALPPGGRAWSPIGR